MIIVYGWDTLIKSEKFLGKKKCDNCDSVTDMYLTREVFRIKLFGIPVLWWTSKRAIMCSNCGMIKKLKKAEYEEIKNNPGLIYNETQNLDETSEEFASWRDTVTDTNINYNENIVKEQNNKTTNPLSIILKIILAPILTFVFWFMYLFIIALFLPAEAEISDTQGAVALILALITSIIIVVKIKFGNKK